MSSYSALGAGASGGTNSPTVGVGAEQIVLHPPGQSPGQVSTSPGAQAGGVQSASGSGLEVTTVTGAPSSVAAVGVMEAAPGRLQARAARASTSGITTRK